MRLSLSIWQPGEQMPMAQIVVDGYKEMTYDVDRDLMIDDNKDMPYATMFVISNASKS